MHHTSVQSSLGHLLRCLERMPTNGNLFTAQSPFFCIFLAALVTHKDEDRNVIRKWFDVIVSAASPRSVGRAFSHDTDGVHLS